MYQRLPVRIWIFFIWALLILVSLTVRPLLPVDETRYASVAWEMWSEDHFLVPHLNGETYSHKPPLLFWLMMLSWRLFGVNDWSLRLISPLFSLATLYLSCRVARALWPERTHIEELAPMILLGSSFWIVYSTLTMFDMMLAFFVLLAIFSLLKLGNDGLKLKDWGLLGLAIGGGVLSKGPVILLHVLPVALTAPWWLTENKNDMRWLHWYGGVMLSVLIGAAIGLFWAIPAGLAGGDAYRNAILFGQTSGRLVQSFAHRLPWWWYLQMLPLCLLPWLFLKPFWTGCKSLTLKDPGIRFCLAWIMPVFIAFSMVSGKRLHYLIPLLPALALVLASIAYERSEHAIWHRAHVFFVALLAFLGVILSILPWLNDTFQWFPDLALLSPIWGIALCIGAIALAMLKAKDSRESAFYTCIASISFMLVVSTGFFSISAYRYDTQVAAQKIAALMVEEKEIAYFGSKYHGQFQFTGRLREPLTVVHNFKELAGWSHAHQSGYIVMEYKSSAHLTDSLFDYHFPFKGHNIGFLSAKAVSDRPELISILTPLG